MSLDRSESFREMSTLLLLWNYMCSVATPFNVVSSEPVYSFIGLLMDFSRFSFSLAI